MNLLLKHKQTLIDQRALFLFFYNFTSEMIDELCELSPPFARQWKILSENALEKSKTTGWLATVEFDKLLTVFATKFTYKTQAVIVEFAFKNFKHEAESNIEFNIKVDEAVANHKGDGPIILNK